MGKRRTTVTVDIEPARPLPIAEQARARGVPVPVGHCAAWLRRQGYDVPVAVPDFALLRPDSEVAADDPLSVRLLGTRAPRTGYYWREWRREPATRLCVTAAVVAMELQRYGLDTDEARAECFEAAGGVERFLRVWRLVARVHSTMASRAREEVLLGEVAALRGQLAREQADNRRKDQSIAGWIETCQQRGRELDEARAERQRLLALVDAPAAATARAQAIRECVAAGRAVAVEANLASQAGGDGFESGRHGSHDARFRATLRAEAATQVVAAIEARVPKALTAAPAGGADV